MFDYNALNPYANQIDLAYKTLPFVCAYCKIGGHPDKLCPTKHQQTRLEIDQLQRAKEDKKLSKMLNEEEFVLVSVRGNPWKNRFREPGRCGATENGWLSEPRVEEQRRSIRSGDSNGLSGTRLSGYRPMKQKSQSNLCRRDSQEEARITVCSNPQPRDGSP